MGRGAAGTQISPWPRWPCACFLWGNVSSEPSVADVRLARVIGRRPLLRHVTHVCRAGRLLGFLPGSCDQLLPLCSPCCLCARPRRPVFSRERESVGSGVQWAGGVLSGSLRGVRPPSPHCPAASAGNQLPQTLGFFSDGPQFFAADSGYTDAGEPGPGRGVAPRCSGLLAFPVTAAQDRRSSLNSRMWETCARWSL